VSAKSDPMRLGHSPADARASALSVALAEG
jgi:hypothetical protein